MIKLVDNLILIPNSEASAHSKPAELTFEQKVVC